MLWLDNGREEYRVIEWQVHFNILYSDSESCLMVTEGCPVQENQEAVTLEYYV